MGIMRFRVASAERITKRMLQQAYLSGFDRVSWPVRTSVDGCDLILQRDVTDSANLHIPWAVEGLGELTLASACLLERDEPYLLPLELARGQIVQVRNQLSDWQLIGLTVPEGVFKHLDEAVGLFSWAAVSQENMAECSEYADKALLAALSAGELLVNAYSEQSITVRRRNGGKLSCFLAADLGNTLLDNKTARYCLSAFNAAEVPMCWGQIESNEGRYQWETTDRQIEWCRVHGLKVLAGPMLLLDRHALPDWLYLFDGDFDNILDFVTEYLRKAIKRYRGQVNCWICAGRVNAPETLGLSEQERLQLAARTIELIRSLDPNTPTMVSFDQPWGEYLSAHESDFPPLHFADALIRADLGLSGLMLEINVGDAPQMSLLRSPLEFNRQLDTWSLLGLPLWLSLSAPSGSTEDSLARYKPQPLEGDWTPAAQQAWALRYLPLCYAKPMVQGVVWRQLCDSEPHDFPHAGLFDAQHQPKPALRPIMAIRQTYL